MRQQLTRLRAALLSCIALVTLSLSVTVVPSVAASAATPGPTTLADAYNLGNSASTSDVACATTTCAAVGSFTTSGGTSVPFVSITTGSSWVTTAVPVTSGSASAVQCPTDNFCVATGTSLTKAVGSAWVGVWSGQSWQFSPLGTDLGASAISAVSSLSCSSASVCAVAGTFVDGSGLYQGFASIFNGEGWASTPVATSLNIGGDAEALGVSCASDGSCTVVGYVTSASFSYQGFSSQFANGAWTTALVGTDVPMMASSVATSVSCWSANNCEVGGSVVDSSGNQQALVGNWNGSAWADQPLESALNVGNNATVTSISCASDGSCAAVGNFLDGNGQEQAFAANLQGGNWSIGQIAQNLDAASASTQAVSCLSRDQCVASGYYIDQSGLTQAFDSVFDGVMWNDNALFSTQNTGGNAVGNAVSCSTTQCLVAGTFADSATSSRAAVQPLAFSAQTPLVFAGPFSNPALSPVTLNGTGGSGQSLEQFSTTSAGCTIANGALTATSLGPCVVTVTNPANGLYTSTTAQQTYTFSAIASPALIIHAGAHRVAGSSVRLTATGGNGAAAVSYSTSTPWCRVQGGTLFTQIPGVCVVTANAAATGVYQSATTTADVVFAAVAQAPLHVRATATRTTGRAVHVSVTGGSGIRHLVFSVAGAGCHYAGAVLSATQDTTCSLRVQNLSNGKYALATSSTLFVVFSRK